MVVLLCCGGCVTAVAQSEAVGVDVERAGEEMGAGDHSEDVPVAESLGLEEQVEVREDEEEENFVFVEPKDMREARMMIQKALGDAFDNATAAIEQCQEAAKDVEDARKHASDVERVLRLLGGSVDTTNQVLKMARAAVDEGVTALDECRVAEDAATAADLAAVNAVRDVLTHSQVRAPSGTSLDESLQKARQHAEVAAKYVARTARYALKAAEAAKKARAAAERGAEASATANEISEAAKFLVRKLMGEEEERWARQLAKIKAEKAAAEAQVAQMSARVQAEAERANAVTSGLSQGPNRNGGSHGGPNAHLTGDGSSEGVQGGRPTAYGMSHTVWAHALLLLLLLSTFAPVAAC